MAEPRGLFSGADPSDTKNLENVLSQYQRNLELSSRLGQPQTGTTELGPLNRFLDYLTRPGRAIQAAAFSATGQPIEELRGLTPQEAALQALQGNLRIGAGDLPGLRMAPSDTFVERGAKAVGAFVGDAVFDPLLYVAPSSILGRKAAAELAVRTGDDILEKTLTAASKNKQDVNAITNQLFEESDLGELIREQQRLGLPVLPESPLSFVRQVDGVVDPADIRRLAAEGIAKRIGNALTTRGRAGVLDELTALTGSREAALQVFSQLPDPIRGGLVFVNPITGKSIARITAGTGQGLGTVGKIANEVRFKFATGTAPITSKISGRAGEAFGAYKKELADVMAGKKSRMTNTLTKYVGLKDLINRAGVIENELNTQSYAAIAKAVSDATNYQGKDLEDYNAGLTYFLTLGNYPITGEESKAFMAGRKAGLTLRQYIRDRFDGARDAGVKISDLGEDWSLLTYTDTYAEKISRTVPQGRKDITDNYRPSEGRKKEIMYIADPEEIARAGFELPDKPGIVALSGIKANEFYKEPRYETDPISIAKKYLGFLDRSVSNQRLINDALAKGILVKDTPITRMVIDGQNAAILQQLTSRLSPAAKKKMQAVVARGRKQLTDLTSEKSVAAVRAEIARMQSNAETEYALAKQTEQQAINELDTITTNIEKIRVRAGQASERLRAYAQSNIEQNVDTAETTARRIRQRVSRSQGKIDDINANIKATQELLAENPDDAYLQDVLNSLQTDGRQAIRDLRSRLATKTQAENQLRSLRETRTAMGASANQQETEILNSFEQLLTQQTAARDAVDIATNARRAAQQKRIDARTARSLEDTEAVNALADSLVSSIQIQKDFAASPVGIAIIKGLKSLDKATRSQIRAGVIPQVNLTEIASKIGVNEQDLLSFIRTNAAVNVARSSLYKSLKYTGRKRKVVTPDQIYAQTVVRAVEKLTNDQFIATRIIANDSKLGSLIEDAATRGDENQLFESIANIYRVYNGTRKVLSADDINNLGLEKYQLKFIRDVAGKKVFKKGTKLETEFGKSLNEIGYQPIGYEGVNLPARFNNMFTGSGVRKSLEALYNVEKNPSEWSRFIEDVFDPLLLLWKTTVTVGRGLGYIFTNIFGGLTNNYITGVSVASHREAARLLDKLYTLMRKEGLDNPNLTYAQIQARMPIILSTQGKDGKILQDFIDRGGLISTDIMYTSQQIQRAGLSTPIEAFGKGERVRTRLRDVPRNKFEEKFRKTIDFGLTNPYQRFFNDMTQKSEAWLRLSAFVDGMRLFKNADAAMDTVYLLHFNYQDLAPFEQWARRIMPFYTWTRNNVPLQFRMALINPGRIERLSKANDAIRSALEADPENQWINDILPEYVRLAEGYATRFTTPEGNPLLLRSISPVQDINRLFEGKSVGGLVPVPRLREVGNMLSPFLSSPIAFLSGVDLATGRSFDPRGAEIPGYLAWIKAVPGATIYDAEGNQRISERGLSILQDLFPIFGVAERQISGIPGISALASQTARERGTGNLLNTFGIPQILTGQAASTLDPRALSGELRRRTTAQRAAIESLAGQQGVDVDRLREQLR